MVAVPAEALVEAMISEGYETVVVVVVAVAVERGAFCVAMLEEAVVVDAK